MLVSTTYPQVPLANTNVATDSVREDNQHRPIIQPTTQPTKSHGERALNNQDKNNQELLIAKKSNHERHGQPQPKTGIQQLPITNTIHAPFLKKLIKDGAGLQTKGIKLPKPEFSPIDKNLHQSFLPSLKQELDFYKKISTNIDKVYKKSITPTICHEITHI